MTENGIKSGKCRFCKSSISDEILKKIEIFNGNEIIGQSPRKYQLTSKGTKLAQELSSQN